MFKLQTAMRLALGPSRSSPQRRAEIPAERKWDAPAHWFR